MVGLGSVDNTSDISKPISTAVQTALNSKPQINLMTAYDANNVFYYQLGTLVLQQNGPRAQIRLEAAQGYAASAGVNFPAIYPPTIYVLDIYIFGSNGNSVAVDSGSNTSGQAAHGLLPLWFRDEHISQVLNLLVSILFQIAQRH
jgi:hypothetical protein